MSHTDEMFPEESWDDLKQWNFTMQYEIELTKEQLCHLARFISPITNTNIAVFTHMKRQDEDFARHGLLVRPYQLRGFDEDFARCLDMLSDLEEKVKDIHPTRQIFVWAK